MTKQRTIITVFGSSRPSDGHAQYAEARALGHALAAQGFVICTGGYGGTMEAASRDAKDAGGQTLAVTAKFFKSRANQSVDEEIRVKSWQDRLWELVKRGHGYVACPGGTGTLVELAVVWEMLNKGVMKGKPLVVLGDFWRPVIERIHEVGSAGNRLVEIARDPVEAAALLARHFEARRVKRTEA